MIDFIILWIIIIITFAMIIYAISLEYQYNSIATYPVPLCYNDWLCKKVVDGEIVEVNMAEKVLFGSNSSHNACMPLTSQNICNFTYFNSDGDLVTEQPGIYLNTWSDEPGCFANNNYEGCPFYKVGDIYWRSCWNNIEGNKYNDRERTYYNLLTKPENCTGK